MTLALESPSCIAFHHPCQLTNIEHGGAQKERSPTSLLPYRRAFDLSPMPCGHRRVNNATGERTYGFDYGGRPVDPKLPPTPTNGGTVHYTAPNGMAYAYTLPGPVPAAYPMPDAHHPVPPPSGAEVVPYYQMGCYQAGIPPVAPVPAGRTNSDSEHFYIRPTFKRGSWMWK